MNILEQLKELGAKFNPAFCLTDVNTKFVISKEITGYIEYSYVVMYNKLPSMMSVEYNKSKFLDLVKFLISHDFEVLSINSSYKRHSSDSITFKSHNTKTLITLGINGAKTFNHKLILNDEDEDYDEFESEVNSLEFNIAYDASEPNEAFLLKETFFEPDDHKPKNKIMLFEKSQYGDLVLTPHKVRNYELDIDENYNDDFKPVHEKITKWMGDFTSRNNKLILLHGVPGSGKTNYIKHLLNNSGTVKKIYIPPFFVQSMADPGFFPVIKREKDSILIIEDAEKVLINREESNDNSVISILLNLCDGIMADVLNFKIVATFNTDEDKIDAALKRKGRMFLKYKFDELSEEKTSNLFYKLYGEKAPKTRMTLAEIYNDENEYGPKKEVKSIGFGV